MERLRGLWACLIGFAVLAVLVLYLNPITDQRQCPNWGGNGNASAFRDDRWDLYLPLLCTVWLAAVIVEQALPSARRSETRGARALAAVLITVGVGCCGVGPLLVVCR
ncbi:hypothetical protein ABT369_40565 [Dactylosporangium sp. NPDC000244]|uniref:hypothetical protein n=1 Tax=Dactylosporangium sp. NPDC000244 TaxID=3154365 RepID=UPI003333A707